MSNREIERFLRSERAAERKAEAAYQRVMQEDGPALEYISGPRHKLVDADMLRVHDEIFVAGEMATITHVQGMVTLPRMERHFGNFHPSGEFNTDENPYMVPVERWMLRVAFEGGRVAWVGFHRHELVETSRKA